MGYPLDPICPVTHVHVIDFKAFHFEGLWVTGSFLGFPAITLIVFPSENLDKFLISTLLMVIGVVNRVYPVYEPEFNGNFR